MDLCCSRNSILAYMKLLFLLLIILIFATNIQAQNNVVNIDWNKTIVVSKTTPTLQVVENPKRRLPSPFHDSTYAALKKLGADYVRYVPWFPYPKLAVAELQPPSREKTFWDFNFLDSTMHAFM